MVRTSAWDVIRMYSMIKMDMDYEMKTKASRVLVTFRREH